MNTVTRRTHVVLPSGVISAIDAVVGRRGRSPSLFILLLFAIS
jgi:hypothetical protein